MPTGEMKKTFWGKKRKTFMADEIILPDSIDEFIALLIAGESKMAEGINGVDIRKLPRTYIYISPPDASY